MDRRNFVRSTLAASVAALNMETVDADAQEATRKQGSQGDLTPQANNEGRPQRSMVRAARPEAEPAFTPLRPGAVKPMGWLRDWAIAARNGITGYLDERHSDFGASWKGAIPGAEQLDKGWPLEMGAYWLDGALRLGYILHDDFLINKAKRRLDLVVNGVNAGATTFVFWRSD
ncbi:MAG: hypothetical protein HY508_00360, partial [Acidobacteria bacterium]|nr:hypothetical protein [Acidobacteriota bacterium]